MTPSAAATVEASELTEHSAGSAGSSGRRQRGRRSAGAIVGLVAVAVLVAGAVVVWASPVLGLETITVQGARSPEVVAEVEAAVGVATGTPLARIGTDAVAARVEAVSAVASARVVRDWPHGLIVTVKERAAVATTSANGSWWLIDKTGLPFRQLAEKPTNLMPLELATPAAGDRATLAALGVLASLSPEVRGTVVAVAAANEYTVTLRLVGDRTVIWGANSDAAAKNAVVPAMLAQPGQVFDVSDPTLVTVAEN